MGLYFAADCRPWPYSAEPGYDPSGAPGCMLSIVLILVLMGRIQARDVLHPLASAVLLGFGSSGWLNFIAQPAGVPNGVHDSPIGANNFVANSPGPALRSAPAALPARRFQLLSFACNQPALPSGHLCLPRL